MKKLECVIRPQKLECVKQALSDAGVLGMTVREVRGCGKQKGFVQHYRASERLINLLPKTEISLIIKDQDLEKVVDIIVKTARTGEQGDGKIFIMDVNDVVQIRTGDRGETAI